MRALVLACYVGCLETAACTPRRERLSAQARLCHQDYPNSPDAVASCLQVRHNWPATEATAAAYAEAGLVHSGALLFSDTSSAGTSNIANAAGATHAAPAGTARAAPAGAVPAGPGHAARTDIGTGVSRRHRTIAAAGVAASAGGADISSARILVRAATAARAGRTG